MATGKAYRFEELRELERERVRKHRENKGLSEPNKWSGLAISGGGIRSASFGLGLLQALDRFGELKKIDFLSTVSGGGYIGSSLTWFTHQKKSKEWYFPYGVRGRGVRSGPGKDPLDFIRQHGNYLKPGDGLSTASLAAMALRNILLSFTVYFLLLVFIFFVLIKLELLTAAVHPGCVDQPLGNLSLYAAAGFGLLLVLITGLYSLGTFAAAGTSRRDYWLRVQVQIILGFVLAIGIVMALIGSLPIVSCKLAGWAAALGGLATSLGSAGGVFEFLRQRRTKGTATTSFSSARIWVTALLLVYGLFLLAYSLAARLDVNLSWEVLDAAMYVLLPSLIFGFFVNTNYFGIGRMYRDRLMETFMPNPAAVEKGRWDEATLADKAKLSDMCGEEELGPYHLVNTNIVLVDSDVAEFRARGGDSFVLSPLFCGCNATGWYETGHFLNDGMTLSTAMAISGAAANPNTGVAGGGPTRNRMISFLMAFANLRLGYFARNPHASGIRKFAASLSPNLLYPGIVQGLLGQRLNAKAGYIELSDGGHFDNTGLYELARRRLDLIIISEAGADPNSTMSDLANAVERIKVDFGYYIEFEKEFGLKNLLPGSSDQTFYDENIRLAKHGFAIGTIEYDKEHIGTLIFVKATLTDDLPADIYAYKKTNAQFPNQSTIDQFFDEVQLEAYRELGYRIGKSLLTTNKVEEKGWL